MKSGAMNGEHSPSQSQKTLAAHVDSTLLGGMANGGDMRAHDSEAFKKFKAGARRIIVSKEVWLARMDRRRVSQLCLAWLPQHWTAVVLIPAMTCGAGAESVARSLGFLERYSGRVPKGQVASQVSKNVGPAHIPVHS